MSDYGYRDLAPRLARFTTVDPIRDGENWYAYVNGDPVNWVDEWGLEGERAFPLILLNGAEWEEVLSEASTALKNRNPKEAVEVLEKYNYRATHKYVNSLEKNAHQLTREILISPQEYSINTYERIALSKQLSKNAILTHSLYVISKSGEFSTLSYNGMAGTWEMNTTSDVESFTNQTDWEMKITTPVEGINNYETAKNIQTMIESTNDSYNFADYMFNFAKDSFNCNTALQKTMVTNSNKNK